MNFSFLLRRSFLGCRGAHPAIVRRLSYNPDVSRKISPRVFGGSLATVILGLVVYRFSRRKKKVQEETIHTEITKVDQPDSASSSRLIIPKGNFPSKCVLITGGAGDIGSAVALAFSKEGAKVVLVDLPGTETTLKEKCSSLVRAGAESASFVTADVTNVEDVKNMVEKTKATLGNIDVFFNNAGIQGKLRPLTEQDDVGYKKVLDVNIYGVFLGMKYVSQAMQESGKGGVIINTASVAGLIGPANMSAYAASKFAVVGMTKSAAKDLARHRIRVCAIAPGILEGKMWDTQIYGLVECRKLVRGDTTPITKKELEDQEERMIEANPIRRQGKLSEVAAVVKFLSSEDASYLTGVVLPIDGGRLK